MPWSSFCPLRTYGEDGGLKAGIHTHPPRKAPTGFLTGIAPVVTSSNLLLDWKFLVWRSAGIVLERRVRAAVADMMRAAMFDVIEVVDGKVGKVAKIDCRAVCIGE